MNHFDKINDIYLQKSRGASDMQTKVGSYLEEIVETHLEEVESLNPVNHRDLELLARCEADPKGAPAYIMRTQIIRQIYAKYKPNFDVTMEEKIQAFDKLLKEHLPKVFDTADYGFILPEKNSKYPNLNLKTAQMKNDLTELDNQKILAKLEVLAKLKKEEAFVYGKYLIVPGKNIDLPVILGCLVVPIVDESKVDTYLYRGALLAPYLDECFYNVFDVTGNIRASIAKRG